MKVDKTSVQSALRFFGKLWNAAKRIAHLCFLCLCGHERCMKFKVPHFVSTLDTANVCRYLLNNWCKLHIRVQYTREHKEQNVADSSYL